MSHARRDDEARTCACGCGESLQGRPNTPQTGRIRGSRNRARGAENTRAHGNEGMSSMHRQASRSRGEMQRLIRLHLPEPPKSSCVDCGAPYTGRPGRYCSACVTRRWNELRAIEDAHEEALEMDSGRNALLTPTEPTPVTQIRHIEPAPPKPVEKSRRERQLERRQARIEAMLNGFKSVLAYEGIPAPPPTAEPYERMADGERRLTVNGYVQVKVDGESIPEHRWVMEQKLGRKLAKGESVHHRNGIRHDNRPENLELWVGPIRYGQRARDIRCPHCGKPWHDDDES